ncbi:cell division protein ZapA [Pseudocolwellia sp. HL-MZ19]|uniref:cell division protein ZapA n=1 Tax=unclassified Pseudocolwellia TaxID=2848178 RepID=UPI003CEB6FA6
MSQNTVTINVANKSLKIACPVGEESALLAAAQELTVRFNKINENTSGSYSSEQSMMMTALNLSYDLLIARNTAEKEKQALQSKIELLQSTIEQALSTADIEKS